MGVWCFRSAPGLVVARPLSVISVDGGRADRCEERFLFVRENDLAVALERFDEFFLEGLQALAADEVGCRPDEL